MVYARLSLPAQKVIESVLVALIAGVLALPMLGIELKDNLGAKTITWHFVRVAFIMAIVFCGRLAFGLWIAHKLRLNRICCVNGQTKLHHLGQGLLRFFSKIFAIFDKKEVSAKGRYVALAFIFLAIIFPFMPFASRYVLDVSIMVLTYLMLAYGLNISVGYAGLLDLGYAGFYAVGAYTYALLSQFAGFGFWQALPFAGALAAVIGCVVGFSVLRLRGDYFAIVTLGFGEVTRIVLINATKLTGGPNGISGIPRPTFFGLEFARKASEGKTSFHDFFGLTFNPAHREIFLYFIILLLVCVIGFVCAKLRSLPLGRAWESFREDEIACASLGINRRRIKLAAYASGALIAGLAGAFFAARQGFVSPESFTFTESATILAIIILGGMGSWFGPILATLFIIGLPELSRELESYRMLAFGAGMILIMIWRPGGIISVRQPTIRLAEIESGARKAW